MLSDPQCYLYFNHPLANTDASLIDILNAIVALKPTDDSPPGHAPVGFAICGLHVDDGLGDARDVARSLDHKTNRVVQYTSLSVSWLNMLSSLVAGRSSSDSFSTAMMISRWLKCPLQGSWPICVTSAAHWCEHLPTQAHSHAGCF